MLPHKTRRTTLKPVRLRIEPLEDRTLLSAATVYPLAAAAPDVTAEEQLFVYQLNRARHNPSDYQLEQNLPVDLSDAAPRPPLAVNDSLFGSAGFHAEEMAANNYFGHQSEVTGDWPNKMARDQGYNLPAAWTSDNNYIESIAAGYFTVEEALDGLIVDEGVPSLGHRIHLLSMDDFTADDREIGVGHAFNSSSLYRHYWAAHITRQDSADTFLTGVVFNDLDGDGRYDLNEGISGVTLSAGTLQTATNAAGGWALQVSTIDTYTLNASGPGFTGTASATVTGGVENVEIDFISGQSWGIVNFDDTSTPPVAVDDRYTAVENTALSVPVASGVLSNDTDAESDPLEATLVDNVAHGTLLLAKDGSFSYTPGANYHGADSFTYMADDGHGNSNVATVSITVVQPLATVDFLQLSGQDPSTGDLWYRAETTRQGIFTLEALPQGAATGADLALYDANGNQLATATPIAGGRRIDYLADAGETFLFSLFGAATNVDLRLANLVHVSSDGSLITVHGTANNDTFTGTAGTPYVVTVNGVAYQSSLITNARFLGEGGSDNATLTGSDGNEAATLYPNSATLTGVGYVVELTGVSAITLNGGGGFDAVTFYDSSGNDTFTGWAGGGLMTAAGTSNTVNGAEEVIAYANAGGVDQANLSDTAGDDLFVATSNYGGITGKGFAVHTQGFDNVRAVANSGGFDLAKLFDSPGDDQFRADPTEAELSGLGFSRRVQTFEAVHAYATNGGDDLAEIFDSPANEVFWGRAVDGGIIGDGFFARAKHFENIHHYADAGGYDMAKFFDSPGNDQFIATPSLGTLSYGDLSGGVLQHHAHRFDAVHAYGTAGGHDTANLYDSAADDLFYGDPIQGAMFEPKIYFNRAKFFDEVYGHADNGGRDRAELYDSAGDDTFTASATESTLSSPASYLHRVSSFEEVLADAGNGGHDEAYFSDSTSPDLLEAQGNWARLSNQTLDFLFEAGAFDYVKATAGSSGNTKNVTEPLDFVLELEGPWPTSS